MTKTTNIEALQQLLYHMGYSQTEGGIWEKVYPFGGKIKVNIPEERIMYCSEIEIGDATTSNFDHAENFVVLECVNRLLDKGYRPQSLSLEKSWQVGRGQKGKLDILVKTPDGQSYLMIECKTWGHSYTAEKRKMISDGGQLFSYFQQDKNAEYLCLYTSNWDDKELRYDNSIVKVEGTFRELHAVKEVHQWWNKQFNGTGIFEDSVQPYNVQIRALTKQMLQELRKEDGQQIYHQFLEILRHNVVSDKANAFNKIFNLFLCKIWDEETRADDEVLEFQWLEEKDTHESLLSRLNSLFKHGMKRYLDKEIVDYEPDDLGKSKDNEHARRMLQELRLYKNQEFAFIEVFNRESFDENARIVREMVRLLEGWQIRYSHKQQFLGDFFELLINTGFKQESGQFFTPVPLVRFILHCMPTEHVIRRKLTAKEVAFLPKIIDFACGAGHFLTEYMDIVQDIVAKLTPDTLTAPQAGELRHYQLGDFNWAKEFMYGIERDYRLVKTAKLACFLHGDGEAHIIHASGLDPLDGEKLKKLGGGDLTS